MHRSSYSLILACAAVAAAQDAPKPQFTARELFYSAAHEPSAKETTKPSAPAVPKAGTSKKPPATTQTPVEPQHPPTWQPTQQPVVLPDGGRMVKASTNQARDTAPAPATGTPLGLKYTILKKSGDDMVEVPPDTVFHNGDKIQLSVQTNGPGYLYVISQGSSGTWKPLFPSSEVEDGNNRVDGWKAKILPPGSLMVLDEQTGNEKLFVVFSRNPEDGLENMIYSLKGVKARPAAGKKEEKAPKQMVEIAQVNIDDATVGQLRETYSTRDLIIEKVDTKTPADKSPGDKKECAVYVVNASGSANSRVVADLKLVHQ